VAAQLAASQEGLSPMSDYYYYYIYVGFLLLNTARNNSIPVTSFKISTDVLRLSTLVRHVGRVDASRLPVANAATGIVVSHARTYNYYVRREGNVTCALKLINRDTAGSAPSGGKEMSLTRFRLPSLVFV
jgi:hypothetical protein